LTSHPKQAFAFTEGALYHQQQSLLRQASATQGKEKERDRMNANDFLRMFAYDHWANGECLRALLASRSTTNNATARIPSPSSTSIVRRLAHILSAEKLWLERIRKEKQSLPVWPSATIDECAALADQMASAWRDYLARLEPGALEENIEYRNSKGEAWSSRVEDVLMHVLMHSAYHRGQIALEMRSAGMEPAYTDFIHAVRQGLLE
jgi:uncharacterized damage-inducible protein DinB